MKHHGYCWHNPLILVAPCAGAWIETRIAIENNYRIACRPLRGGVD